MVNSQRDENTRPLDPPPQKLCAGQEAAVIAGHRTKDWFQIRKGVCQGCILLQPCNLYEVYICLCKLYEDYIIQNTRLDEIQPGIKIAGGNISNLR